MLSSHAIFDKHRRRVTGHQTGSRVKGGIMTSRSKIGKALALTLALVLIGVATGSAEQFMSPRISGNFVYQNGSPAYDRQLHFQNRASSDLYVAATDERGDFSASLPPGIYDLRAERGVILKRRIVVTDS